MEWEVYSKDIQYFHKIMQLFLLSWLNLKLQYCRNLHITLKTLLIIANLAN